LTAQTTVGSDWTTDVQENWFLEYAVQFLSRIYAEQEEGIQLYVDQGIQLFYVDPTRFTMT